MPDRVYVPRSHPPKVQDRVAAHWLEIVLAFAGVVRGFLTLVGESVRMSPPDDDHIPQIWSILVATALIVGGCLWIFSNVRKFATINRYFLALRTGLGLLVLGWWAYFIPSLFYSTVAMYWVASFSAAVGVTGSYAYTFINERTIRKGGRQR